MSPTDAPRQAQCAHARRWYYRSAFKFAHGKPSVELVERCQECGANPRGEGVLVPTQEVLDAGLIIAMLDVDPWKRGRS